MRCTATGRPGTGGLFHYSGEKVTFFHGVDGNYYIHHMYYPPIKTKRPDLRSAVNKEQIVYNNIASFCMLKYCNIYILKNNLDVYR